MRLHLVLSTSMSTYMSSAQLSLLRVVWCKDEGVTPSPWACGLVTGSIRVSAALSTQVPSTHMQIVCNTSVLDIGNMALGVWTTGAVDGAPEISHAGAKSMLEPPSHVPVPARRSALCVCLRVRGASPDFIN